VNDSAGKNNPNASQGVTGASPTALCTTAHSPNGAFAVSQGGGSTTPAQFIFVSQDGTISGGRAHGSGDGCR